MPPLHPNYGSKPKSLNKQRRNFVEANIYGKFVPHTGAWDFYPSRNYSLAPYLRYRRAGLSSTDAAKVVKVGDWIDKFSWYVNFRIGRIESAPTLINLDFTIGPNEHESKLNLYNFLKKFSWCRSCGDLSNVHDICERCNETECTRCGYCSLHTCDCTCFKCGICEIKYPNAVPCGCCPECETVCKRCCRHRCHLCYKSTAVVDAIYRCVCVSCDLCKTINKKCQCSSQCSHEKVCKGCCRHTFCHTCNKCSDTCNCQNTPISPCDIFDAEGENHIYKGNNLNALIKYPLTFWDSTEVNPYLDKIRASLAAGDSHTAGLLAHKTISRYRTRKTLNPTRLKEFSLNPSRRFASAEIEVSKAFKVNNIQEVCAKWKSPIVPDACVDKGYEINTAPANGNNLVSLITDMANALREDRASVSDKCGLHVHVDTRSFRYYDIKRLVLLYSKIESALFAIVSPERYESQWSVPCGRIYTAAVLKGEVFKGKKNKNNSAKLKVITSVYGDRGSEASMYYNENTGKYEYGAQVRNPETAEREIVKQGIYKSSAIQHRGGNRYYALNLHSWFYRGTVEFRMHQGTTNAEKILGWMKILCEIVDFVEFNSESSIEKILQSPSREYKKVIESLNGRDPRESILTNRNESMASVMVGIAVLQRILSNQSMEFYFKRANRFLFGDDSKLSPVPLPANSVSFSTGVTNNYPEDDEDSIDIDVFDDDDNYDF